MTPSPNFDLRRPGGTKAGSLGFRSVACLCLLLVLVPAAAVAEGAPWLTSVDQAFAAAKEDDRYVLVDLYAEWCGWCKVLEREVFTSPEFHQLTREMVLLRVDVEDGGEGSDLQARYEANSLPTTLILDADMVKVGEVKGYAPTPKFVAAVRGELEEFETMLGLYDRVKRGTDVELMRRLAEDFHGRGDGARAAELYQQMLGQTSGGTAEAWLHYLSADAYRLARQYARAEASLARSLEVVRGQADTDFRERADLLGYQIAHDSGNCGAAVSSLERFIESHPSSGFHSQARRTLAAIRRGDEMKCG